MDDRGWLVDRTGQRYTLRGREIVRLGRAADNDVIIDADTVSRHHAELRWQAGQWFVYDLGSTNGTTVAGAPVSADPVLLPAGATLRLGDRALTFVTS
jgi:pSer/pThr/pTyr-binding forkhead associated (FHA) protein